MIFLDLDNTICESRQIISPKMKKKLLTLKEPFVVISGTEKSRIIKQMDGVPCIVMGQNGNDAPNWQNKLTKKESNEILKHLKVLEKYIGWSILDEETVHHRGCQISFSFTGHNADIKWKKKFDPKKKYRNYILKQVPFKSKNLIVKVAGTTCFDYNRKDCLKGNNLKRYMKLHKLNKKDCIYFGDAFGKGENDESVKGVMRCVKVKDPQDLLTKLKKI